MVGNIPEEQVEDIQRLLQQHLGDQPSNGVAGIESFVDKKVINTSQYILSRSGASSLDRRELDKFETPTNFSTKSRFLALSKPPIHSVLGPGPFLLEKKQYTEAVTIDKGKHLYDIYAAIYRHPNYQGEAASGYKMKCDIYSFGWVLMEIALWTPLLVFLDAKGHQPPGTVQLSSAMTTFHKEEALGLKRRALERIKVEMPFRVGSRFCNAMQ
ncbi:MAG: hypothetical protein M1834_000111 [Cirrosporium novae-zelandiae]|nr:MAG: hypothetical protein M1834_000111 [Cirrosporium novae-zelandiae]